MSNIERLESYARSARDEFWPSNPTFDKFTNVLAYITLINSNEVVSPSWEVRLENYLNILISTGHEVDTDYYRFMLWLLRDRS